MTIEQALTRMSTFLLIAIVTMTTIGCATGPAFEQVQVVSPDKALVYIYRLPGLRGSAFSPEISIGDQVKFPLQIGGYRPCLVDPGNVTISITNVGTRSIVMDINSGETYYVKGGTVPMGFGVPSIEVVQAEIALTEIKRCKLLSDVAPPK